MKSHYKKLVRLAKSSSSMIDEFGFRLFLNTAISELKKNKLQVFAPVIEHEEPKISEESAYQQWIRAHAITSSKRFTLKNKLQTFQISPKFHVCIITSEKNKKFLSNTIESLTDQVYDLFDFSVKGVGSQSENLIDISPNQENPIPFTLKEKYRKYDDIITVGYDYTVFLQSGSMLTSDALYQIAEFLNRSSNADIIYSDEDYLSSAKNRINPFFKPCWSPDLFLSMDYISNFFVVRNTLLDLYKILEVYESAQFYEFILRISENTDKIFRIPLILVSIRLNNDPSFTDGFSTKALKAISDFLSKKKINAIASLNDLPTGTTSFRVRYLLSNEPKVSIIIPTKDNKLLLDRCISAIKNKTDYSNYEIIIIDNNSVKKDTVTYLKSLPYTIIKHQEPFNFSTMNNISVSKSIGDYLLFMNDDAAPIDSGWLTEMVSICQQENVGVVGPKLVHSDRTIQHAGISLLRTGAGFHPFQNVQHNKPTYFGLANMIRNCSAVTGACLLIKRKVFEEIGMFDEDFDLYYVDTDLCMKTIKKGYRVIYTPYALLLHQGSSTIKENSSAFFAVENHRSFISKWPILKDGDPFYNPNLGWNYKIDIKNIEKQTT